MDQEQQHRERCWAGGWNITPPDDDLPNWPGLSPLDSAQARRYARQEQNKDAP
jgi:hypothetical protein